jgi:hypothetical protein
MREVIKMMIEDETSHKVATLDNIMCRKHIYFLDQLSGDNT